MLRNLRLSSLVLCAALAAAFLAPAEASADCRRGDRRCKRATFRLHVPGKVHIHASASANFGIRAPRQVVVVRPTPPPPPPPPPPPVVVVRPQPQVTVQQHPQVVVRPTPAPLIAQRPPRSKNFGVRIAFGGMGGDVNMVGGQLAFKYRPRMGFFALEAAGGIYGGTDYNGLDRTETPFTLGAQFYFNPRSKFQIFALIGFGGSHAEVDGYDSDRYTSYESNDYSYLGGFAGLGAELRLGRWFALSGDLRAFLRDRTDFGADANPEFYDPATGKTTNTSTGVLATFGGTFYF